MYQEQQQQQQQQQQQHYNSFRFIPSSCLPFLLFGFVCDVSENGTQQQQKQQQEEEETRRVFAAVAV